MKFVLYLTSVNHEYITVRELDDCISRLASRDISAMSELYDLTRDKIYGYALSMVKAPADAEDILHDLYVAVYDAAPDYRSSGKPMAWLITITKNLCLMNLRSAKKTGRLPEPVGEDTLADVNADHATRTEDKLFIDACMTQLSDVDREILILHAVSDLKFREIAQIMALPLSTVLSKYHRAIKTLKKYSEGSY